MSTSLTTVSMTGSNRGRLRASSLLVVTGPHAGGPDQFPQLFTVPQVLVVGVDQVQVVWQSS